MPPFGEIGLLSLRIQIPSRLKKLQLINTADLFKNLYKTNNLYLFRIRPTRIYSIRSEES